MAAESDISGSPFTKQLASSDKKTRDTALRSLRTYLSTRPSIPTLDLLKLWKGLFYCLWMQDKPALQQRLARDLASLLTVLKPDVVVPFMEAFWQTMSREWRNIEALRMDKYLYLVRQYVNAGFGWAGTNTERAGSLAKVLEQGPLHAKDVKVPDGLRYHILDVYVDELEKVEGEQLQGKQEILEKLLEPVIKLGKEGRHKALRKAAKELLDDERVNMWSGEEVEEAKEGGEDDEWGGIEE